MYFFVILDFLNKALENNRGKSLNHFYAFLYIFLKNMANFLLSSLGSTLNLIPSTSIL